LTFAIDPPKGYFEREAWLDEIVRKKPEIDALLGDLNYNEIEHEADTTYFKTCAVELAHKYAHWEWLHTPWLTSRILTQVLDSELVPLQKQAFGVYVPGRLTSILPGHWGRLVPAILSFIGLLVSALIILLLFRYDHPLLGFVGAMSTVWHFISRMIVNFRMRRERKRLTSLYTDLRLIREEVSSGHYDAVEVERRLRRSEEKGLYVHSLAYTLLKCKANLPKPMAVS
jgi:hypothetical protein